MAWNRSSNPSGGNPDKGIRILVRDGISKCPRSIVKGLVAGGIVVVGAVLVLFYLTQNKENNIAVQQKAEANPVSSTEAPRNVGSEASVAQKAPAPREEEYIEVNGKKIKLAADPKTGKPKYDKNVRIVSMRASDIKTRRFEYDAEEDIAAMLEIDPGTLMYGEIPYGKRFNDSLAKSFMVPVEIKTTDDEYTVALKKQVQEIKDGFRKLLLEGGDPAGEMMKAREDLVKLGQYRNILVQELNELRKSGQYTSQDVKDFLTAANKMIEGKGLKPITMPAVVLRNLELKERKIQK